MFNHTCLADLFRRGRTGWRSSSASLTDAASWLITSWRFLSSTTTLVFNRELFLLPPPHSASSRRLASTRVWANSLRPRARSQMTLLVSYLTSLLYLMALSEMRSMSSRKPRELVGIPGLVTNACCWLFTIKDRCEKVRFQPSHIKVCVSCL